LAWQVETCEALANGDGVRSESVRAACEALARRIASMSGAGLVALVVRGVDPGRLVGRLRLPGYGAGGVVDRNHGPEGLGSYRAVPGLEVPDAPVYALVGLERGDEYRGLTPLEALRDVARRGRSPLTIEEGLAAALHHPELLARGHGFSLAGSRRGDKRVPTLWISKNTPKLGWCWEGNPHDWLGLASVAGRLT
jgi:hypothetical protein